MNRKGVKIMNTFGTYIGMTYTTGLNMHMGRAAAMPYLEGLAISTIMMCRTIKADRTGELRSELPYLDNLVHDYCDGLHSCALFNILDQNAVVLYSFLEDCVTNDSVKALHLLTHTSAAGKYVWELLPLALKEYQTFLTQLSAMDGKFPTRDFTKYNEAFSDLMRNSN